MHQAKVRNSKSRVQVESGVGHNRNYLELRPDCVVISAVTKSSSYLQSKQTDYQNLNGNPDGSFFPWALYIEDINLNYQINVYNVELISLNHQVEDEVKKRANTKDDRPLSEKGAAMRLLVLVRPGRPCEEHQEVQQEHAGHQQQVDKQEVGLKVFWWFSWSLHDRIALPCSPPYLHIMVNLWSEMSVNYNDNIDGYYENTVSAG